jgi:two-component system sensor histidine kinase KdpD
MLPDKNQRIQFATSSLAVVLVAAVSYPFKEVIGYRAVALILMLVVSILAMRFSLYPVLLAAVLSALIWDYFFIPPYFTLHVNDPADALLLGMYFAIASLNGVLTARMRRYEKIAREKESRLNTLKLYDTVFNALSHELRTPISTILGASDNLLFENSGLTETAKKSLYAEINGAAERLNRLTVDLLNLSRLESGFLQPKLDWCEVSELVYTVTNSLEEFLKDRQLVIDIQDNMPLVKLDFVLMEQVLRNLVLNAARHTPDGGRIFINSSCREGVFSLSVTDSGKGFPPDEIEHVFEKFQRLSNAQTGGLGLGLSIAKGFVEAHGGTVEASNEPGFGARITLHIPVETNALNSLDHE